MIGAPIHQENRRGPMCGTDARRIDRHALCPGAAGGGRVKLCCSISAAASCWPKPGSLACMRHQGGQAAADNSCKPRLKNLASINLQLSGSPLCTSIFDMGNYNTKINQRSIMSAFWIVLNKILEPALLFCFPA
eukprot:1142238-Pelagomonas_calceolata.AAC.2